MNTPIEYMYQNPYYGGVGQQPTPQFYNQPMNMNTQFMNSPGIQQEPITASDGQEVVGYPIPSGLSSASMPQQFQYQNDWRYQYYGTNQSYYNSYGSYYGNWYNQNPLKHTEPGFYNPYNSEELINNFNQNKPFNIPSQTIYDTNYQYFSVAQQQRAIQEANQNHMKTYEMLCDLVYRNNGYSKEEIQQKRDEQLQEQNRKYQHWCEYNREAQVCMFIQQLAAQAPDPTTYEAPARRRYIEEWNKKHDEWVEKFGNPTLQEFFNEGVAENMTMQYIIDDAVRRSKQLNRLYDRQAFRNYLASQHPGYNPQTGLSQYAGQSQVKIPLTIDDMEIRLPDHIKNTDEFKRKERFINEVMKNMVVK